MPEPVDAPSPFDHRRLLLGSPGASRLGPALVAALGLGLAATAVTLAGRADVATVVSLGAFAGLYAVNRPYRHRAPLLGAVVLLLAVCVGLGAAVQLAAERLGPTSGLAVGAVVVAGVTGVAAVATFAANALALGPPGGYFFALSAAMSAQLASHGLGMATIVALTLLGGASAWLVSMAPALWASHRPTASRLSAADAAVARHLAAVADDRATSRTRTDAALALHEAWVALAEAGRRDSDTARALHGLHSDFAATLGRPEQGVSDAAEDRDRAEDIPLGRPTTGYLVHRALHVDTVPSLLALRVVISCIVAGLAAVALGASRPDWAIASAILVLHGGVDRLPGTYRALHRLLGTTIGLLVFAGLYAVRPSGLVLVGTLVVLQFLIELVVVRNYAVAVTFITALVLLVTTRPGMKVDVLMRDRLVDTLVGVAVGVIVLWTIGRRFWREGLPRQLARVERAVAVLRGRLREDDTDGVLEARRDLQFELIEAARTADTAHRNAPTAAGAHWQRHLELQHEGYALLAACWAVDR